MGGLRQLSRPLSILLTAILLIPALAEAKPKNLDDRLAEARAARQRALADARVAADRLAALRAEYEAVEAQAERAAALVVDAALREAALQGSLAQARSLLNARASAVYRAGPAAFVDVLLESESFGDLMTSRELVERALMADVEQAAEALEARDAARRLRRELEAAKARLQVQHDRLRELQAQMASVLAEAQAQVRKAGVKVSELEREKVRMERAEARQQQRAVLLRVPADQSALLALLGPDGGRGCDIPSGLQQTGQGFSGQASFYGEEFAGQPTATGAIFVPELFTAAHLTLPLPSFLHVRYGGKCATVLVNDRGPYVEGRVLDLSQGAAQYLGLPGVDVVEAEILTIR
jgi:rare lipoprotein A (peptidoglycan hydrolase)